MQSKVKKSLVCYQLLFAYFYNNETQRATKIKAAQVF